MKNKPDPHMHIGALKNQLETIDERLSKAISEYSMSDFLLSFLEDTREKIDLDCLFLNEDQAQGGSK